MAMLLAFFGLRLDYLYAAAVFSMGGTIVWAFTYRPRNPAAASTS
jgi:hypothetical protein